MNLDELLEHLLQQGKLTEELEKYIRYAQHEEYILGLVREPIKKYCMLITALNSCKIIAEIILIAISVSILLK